MSTTAPGISPVLTASCRSAVTLSKRSGERPTSCGFPSGSAAAPALSGANGSSASAKVAVNLLIARSPRLIGGRCMLPAARGCVNFLGEPPARRCGKKKAPQCGAFLCRRQELIRQAPGPVAAVRGPAPAEVARPAGGAAPVPCAGALPLPAWPNTSTRTRNTWRTLLADGGTSARVLLLGANATPARRRPQ